MIEKRVLFNIRAGLFFLLLIIVSPIFLCVLICFCILKLIELIVVKIPTYVFFKVFFKKIVQVIYPSRLGVVHLNLFKLERILTKSPKPHSRIIRIDLRTISGACHIFVMSAHKDNYSFLVVDFGSCLPYNACIIDACDKEELTTQIREIENSHYAGVPLNILAVLSTHHHWDHVYGNEFFKKKYNLDVYGSSIDVIPGVTKSVTDEDIILIGNLYFTVYTAPCHTQGSLLYMLNGVQGEHALFTGDAMFLGGSGGQFEGNDQQQEQIFWKIRCICTEETLLFPGHEYTLMTLGDTFQELSRHYSCRPNKFFALCGAILRASHLREKRNPPPTVPYIMREEFLYNKHFIKMCCHLRILLLAYRANRILNNLVKYLYKPGDIKKDYLIDEELSSTSSENSPSKKQGTRKSVVAVTYKKQSQQSNSGSGMWVINNKACSNPIAVLWQEDLQSIKNLFNRSEDINEIEDSLNIFFSNSCCVEDYKIDEYEFDNQLSMRILDINSTVYPFLIIPEFNQMQTAFSYFSRTDKLKVGCHKQAGKDKCDILKSDFMQIHKVLSKMSALNFTDVFIPSDLDDEFIKSVIDINGTDQNQLQGISCMLLNPFLKFNKLIPKREWLQFWNTISGDAKEAVAVNEAIDKLLPKDLMNVQTKVGKFLNHEVPDVTVEESILNKNYYFKIRRPANGLHSATHYKTRCKICRTIPVYTLALDDERVHLKNTLS